MIEVILSIAIKFIFLIIIFLVGMLLLGIERKVTAKIQRRSGSSIFQPLLDVAKAMSKEEHTTYGWSFDFSLVLMFGGILATLIFIPIGGLGILEIPTDMILLLFLLMMPPIGLLLSMGFNENKIPHLISSKYAVLFFLCMIPLYLIIFSIMIFSNTSTLQSIISNQEEGWFIFTLPLGAISYFVISHAMLGKKPFETSFSDIKSEAFDHLGGKYLGLLIVYKALMTIVVLSLFINLFFGGAIISQNPNLSDLINFIINFCFWLMLVIIFFMIHLVIDNFLPKFKTRWTYKSFLYVPIWLSVINIILVIGFLGGW